MGRGTGVPSSSETGFSDHTGINPPPFSSLGNPCWVGEGTVLGPLRTILLHPLEGWPRQHRQRQRSVCLGAVPRLQLASGWGVGKRRRARRRKGGVGGCQSRISETGSRMGCAFLLGKGPQDA